MTISETLSRAITEAIETLQFPSVSFVIEHPSDISHGDYATNVALILGKELGKNPKELAEIIVAELNKKNIKEVESFEVAGPGFINIHLSRDFFVGTVAKILEDGKNFGANKSEAQKKIMVEYTQPNPFKPFHIGHLMSNALGESISRLFDYSGAEVKRANYQGDVGLHVAKALWGIKKTGASPSFIEDIGKAYVYGNTEYENNPKAKQEIDEINKQIYEKKDPELVATYEKGRETSLSHFEEIYKALGTKFDFYFFESESAPVGEKLVKEGLSKGVFEESEGAIIFRGEKHGLHTRVFRTSQGLTPYEAKDLGLIKLKEEKYDADIFVTITALEQKEYFNVVKAVMQELFPTLGSRVKHISHGMLRLKSGKMSSRKGNIITGESLLHDMSEMVEKKVADRDLGSARESIIDDVAVAAIKYSVLKQSVGKDIVFDPEKALSFEGDSGPYIQYTYVRAMSVLRKAKEGEKEARAPRAPEVIYLLERLIYRFPEVIIRAQKEYEPHYVTTFVTEVAGAFNSFYGNTLIIDDSPESSYKLALTKAVSIVLQNGLSVLGIRVPDKM